MNDGYTPPSPNVSLAAEVKAIAENYPDLIKAYTKQIIPIEQAKYEAARTMSPQYYQMMLDNQDYLKKLAALDSDVKAQTQEREIASDVRTLQGPGQAAIRSAMDAERMADPEFYRNRGLIGDKMAEALVASSATLSPTERAEMERSIARTDPRNTTSALNTAKNAMLFGKAGTEKANNLAKVVNEVSSSLPALRSGVDVYGIGTGRAGLTGGAAQTRYGQGYQMPGSEAFVGGADAFNKANQLEIARQQIKGGKPTSMQNLLMGTQAFSNMTGAVGNMASMAYGGY